jgi:hypothetical protein
VRFEALRVVTMKITVFWDVMQCNPVDIYKCIGGTCCPCLQNIIRARKMMVSDIAKGGQGLGAKSEPMRAMENERDSVAVNRATLIEKIGEVGHVIETKMKEHHWHINLCHPDNSGMADYRINLGHHVQITIHGLYYQGGDSK